ncbi:MAG: restriction endonuclease subunit S [Betaproteobacteria bacterium]|nr:restriction endonuclease subunit S [Betaproteobacteria bacterium]
MPIADLQAPKRWALNGGPFGSKLVSRDYVDTGVPVIRGANLPNDRRFSHDDLVFVSEEKADELLANNAHPGDVVFTQRGTLGQVGIIPINSPYRRYVISQSQMKLTVDESRVDALWLFYCFRNPTTQQEMINRASSSGVPHINLGVLREFRIRLPSLPEQRRIASILSAYDDLIENNTRRIAILEEMARRIYEEWFVRLRFPGHEGVRMVESELGLVPAGWTIEAVEAVTETLGGGTPSKTESDYWDGGDINWYSPTDLTSAKTVFMEESASKITELGLAKSSAKLFPPNSVMMTSRATLGVIAVNTTPACTNQGFIVCVPSDRLPLWLLFHWLKANESEFEGLATGATFKEITKGVFRKIKLAVPAKPTATAFEGVVGPMMDLVLRLERKNRNLRTTRDLLLPKLISGELDVSALPEPEALAA